MIKMTSLKLLVLSLVVAALLPFVRIAPVNAAALAHPYSIAVVVNDEAVTEADVWERLKLMLVSSGLSEKDDIAKDMRPQVLSMLIDETLKLQEAKNLGLDVSEDDVKQGFEQLAKQNNMSAEEFTALLKKQNIPVSTLHDQIRAQIAWSKVVQERIRPQIRVTDADVEMRFERLRRHVGKTEYELYEIFLPVDTPKQDPEAKQLANRLVDQIRRGEAPFTQVAHQFSQSAAAANGGRVGWIAEGSLDPEIDEALRQMKTGELSAPVRDSTGYHVLYLRNKRTLTEETLPEEQAVRNEIGMERMERMARRYLLDLKADAYIDRRS